MFCFTRIVRRTCLLHNVLAPFTVQAGARRLPHVAANLLLATPSSLLCRSRRGFRDLAPKPNSVQPSPPVAKELDSSNQITAKEQRKNDWAIITKLTANVWPKNDWKTRGTVLLGFGLLVSGKVSCEAMRMKNKKPDQLISDVIFLDLECPGSLDIQKRHRCFECRYHCGNNGLGGCRKFGTWLYVSIFFSGLQMSRYSLHQSTDGAARIGATVFGELLNAVFANIGQRAIRKVARETFEHLLNLDLRFHLSRQTGGLTRAIDRGTKLV